MRRMRNKILLGLILSALGLGISLASPILYIMLVSYGVQSFLGHELAPGLPLHLILAVIGVPISVGGLLVFRRGVREELEEAALAYARPLPPEGLERLNPPTAPTGRQAKEATPGGKTGEVGEPPPSSPSRGGVKVKSAGTTIICPKCGSESSVGSKKCQECGESFTVPSDPDRACPICGYDLGSASTLGDDVYVCGYCFSELVIEAELAKKIF
jgi:hypothetical protein